MEATEGSEYQGGGERQGEGGGAFYSPHRAPKFAPGVYAQQFWRETFGPVRLLMSLSLQPPPHLCLYFYTSFHVGFGTGYPPCLPPYLPSIPPAAPRRRGSNPTVPRQPPARLPAPRPRVHLAPLPPIPSPPLPPPPHGAALEPPRLPPHAPDLRRPPTRRGAPPRHAPSMPPSFSPQSNFFQYLSPLF